MKNSYIVTERAGPRVAGRIVEKGQPLALTLDEARFELLCGSIRKPQPGDPVAEGTVEAAEALAAPREAAGEEGEEAADKPVATRSRKK